MSGAAVGERDALGPQPFRDRLVRLLAVGEVGVLAALVLITVFFYLLQPAFLSERNIRAVLTVVSFDHRHTTRQAGFDQLFDCFLVHVNASFCSRSRASTNTPRTS